MDGNRPIILHLGEPVEKNIDLYKQLESDFTIIRPSVEERQRDAFSEALRHGRWGQFSALMRPFWNSGGEMGRWDRELVPLLPQSCKVFASAGAGYDWADIDVLAEHGVVYCNGAAASSEAVADMALYHIISVFRQLTWSSLAARSGDNDQWREAHRHVPETAHNPNGHRLGIIGLGRIGSLIGKKARAAFSMEIWYHDIEKKAAADEHDLMAKFCPSLDDMLPQVDCVVLATPFGGEKLITADVLRKFKPGSRFVNIARGALVDEDALLEALSNGHISAAGLDVHAGETRPSEAAAEHPIVNPGFIKMRNVSLTSHNAGGAVETRDGFERLAMQNVMRVLQGEEPLTPVNKHLFK